MDKKEKIEMQDKIFLGLDSRKGSHGTEFDDENEVEQCSFENRSLIYAKNHFPTKKANRDQLSQSQTDSLLSQPQMLMFPLPAD